MEANVADFWHQPPWGILGCNAELWLLSLRCVEQLLFLCSRRFGCFSFEGNCWEVNFFTAEKNCPLVSFRLILPMTRVVQLWGWTGGISWVSLTPGCLRKLWLGLGTDSLRVPLMPLGACIFKVVSDHRALQYFGSPALRMALDLIFSKEPAVAFNNYSSSKIFFHTDN